MLIVADNNIAQVREAFSSLGEVRTLPSSEIDRRTVADADILLSRSTIRVGPELLRGSNVHFYATATSGTDHVDIGWLREAGIGFASAHGSNARAVAEWFVAALDRAGLGLDWSGLRIGIIGVGAVGTQVAEIANTCGAQLMCCDPPRARRGDAAPCQGGWSQLTDVMASCDVVTFHVPLTHEGPDATAGFIGRDELELLGSNAIFVNAARGGIVRGDDLLSCGRRLLLDVFEGEPDFHVGLAQRAEVATPHVAGHSVEGKLAGTRMILDAACRHLGRTPPAWRPALLPAAPYPCASPADAVQMYTKLGASDAALRGWTELPVGQRGAAFRQYRRGFRRRHEFRTGAVVNADADGILRRLGFNVLAPSDAQ